MMSDLSVGGFLISNLSTATILGRECENAAGNLPFTDGRAPPNAAKRRQTDLPATSDTFFSLLL